MNKRRASHINSAEELMEATVFGESDTEKKMEDSWGICVVGKGDFNTENLEKALCLRLGQSLWLSSFKWSSDAINGPPYVCRK
ncbi:hypothetical protein FF1_004616 [Malus domestica]